MKFALLDGAQFVGDAKLSLWLQRQRMAQVLAEVRGASTILFSPSFRRARPTNSSTSTSDLKTGDPLTRSGSVGRYSGEVPLLLLIAPLTSKPLAPPPPGDKDERPQLRFTAPGARKQLVKPASGADNVEPPHPATITAGLVPHVPYTKVLAKAKPGSRKWRRALRRVLLASAALVLVGGVAYVATVSYVLPRVFAIPVEDVLRLHYQNSRAAILDSSTRLAGIGTEGAADGLEARRGSLYALDLPPNFQDFAAALEDRHFGEKYHPRWFRGVDLVCLPLAHFVRRGCSTLPMLAVKNIADLKERQRRGDVSVMGRKLVEIATAPVLVGHLSNDEIVRLVASHSAFATGGGGDIVGIEAGAQGIWGGSAGGLAAWQSAILAAALQRPVRLADGNDPNALARWNYLVSRAQKAVRLALKSPQREQVLADLGVAADNPPWRRTELDGLQVSYRAQVNLSSRRGEVLGNVWGEVKAELQDRGLAGDEHRLAGMQLTLDAAANHRMRGRVESALSDIQKKLGCRLRVRLTDAAEDSRVCREVADERAQVMAVLVDADGRILRFHKSGDGALEPIFSGVAGRRENGGRYDWEVEHRDSGSLAKLAAALLFAARGDAPTSSYCQKYHLGRHGPQGTTGFKECSAGAYRSASTTFAASDNLAIRWRLAQADIGLDDQISLAGQLRLALPRDQHPSDALAFGSVRGSAKAWLELMLALGNESLKLSPTSTGVHFVERVMPVRTAAWQRPPSSSAAAAAVKAHVSTPEARSFIREITSAPVEGGTLRFVKGMCGKVNASCFGKTGTAINRDGAVIDKFTTGFFEIDGHFFAWLTNVRAPTPARAPLGSGIDGGAFAPLVQILLEEAQAHIASGYGPPRLPRDPGLKLILAVHP